jgi:hypothetical protein
MNKTNTIKLIKEYLSELNDNQILIDKEKEIFMFNHFSKSDKFKDALKNSSFLYFKKKRNPEWIKTFCWFVVDSNFIETSVSPKFDEIVNEEKQVKMALRECISNIVIEFRSNIKFGIDKCFISGEILYSENTHIDHYNYTFKNLVINWMDINKYDFKYLYKFVFRDKSRNYFTDNSISESFIKYHNANTNLRAILKSLNKSNLTH